MACLRTVPTRGGTYWAAPELSSSVAGSSKPATGCTSTGTAAGGSSTTGCVGGSMRVGASACDVSTVVADTTPAPVTATHTEPAIARRANPSGRFGPRFRRCARCFDMGYRSWGRGRPSWAPSHWYRQSHSETELPSPG